MPDIQKIIKSHSEWPAVKEIYHTLRAHGYKAFLAGGCVRDALLGISAHDLDLATDASPENVERLFVKTVGVGKSFGVIRVLVGGADIEVATFRTDLSYKDGRRPEGIIFSSPEEDACRRDFTVNALFYDVESDQVLDFVGGVEDLNKKQLRTVGVAEARFQEDHLRLLRGARFVSQLGFSIVPETLQAMTTMAPQVITVSGERLRDEMGKLLKGPAIQAGLDVMQVTGLMQVLFPFRLRDNQWQDVNNIEEPWQRMALFLRKTDRSELQDVLLKLKFSNKEQKALEKCWILWNQPQDFFSLSLGRQLIQMSEEGVAFAVGVLKQEGGAWQRELSQVSEAWEELGRVLPKNFLSGADLQGKVSGRAMGALLAQALELQLEKKIVDRQAALMWVQQQLNLKN